MEQRTNQPAAQPTLETVRRIFEEQGFGNAELLEAWDGEGLDYLRDLLTEEEMQVLLDELQDLDDV